MKIAHHNRRSMSAVAVLALSIAAIPDIVNGQDRDLPSVNQEKKSSAEVIVGLTEVLMEDGTDGRFGDNLARVIGLPKAMPTKNAIFDNKLDGKDTLHAECFLVYDQTSPDVKKPVCYYLARRKDTNDASETNYYRIGLDGNLEKAVRSHGKKDANGKPIRGSGTKTDLDPRSPEVKKAFDSEMKVLRAWLKKQKKPAGKKAPAKTK